MSAKNLTVITASLAKRRDRSQRVSLTNKHCRMRILKSGNNVDCRERKAPLEPRTVTELRVAEPIRSRRPTKPLEYGALNFGQLRCSQCAEFANGASGRVSSDALRDERALLEKRNSNFASSCELRGAVVWKQP
jgi:hypothetical protein